MIEKLRALPPHVRARLAGALEAGQLLPNPSAMTISATLGSDLPHDEILSGLQVLADLGVTGRGAGAWLRTMDEALMAAPRPDLVWSGPGVPGLYARDTRRVYEELITSAHRSIWACSYAFFDGPKAFDLLARRMEEVDGIKVTLLLNIQRKKGDTTTADDVVRRFAERFWKEEWPGSKRPLVYFDPRSVSLDGPAGVLHAKALVVDREVSFITSANLTEYALDHNVELGVLVRDRAFALTVTGYFQGLIDGGLLSLLPAS